MASTFENCYIPYKLGKSLSFYNIMNNGVPYFSPMWFGTKTGVTGISNLNSDLHICYHSFSDKADGSGKRIPNKDDTQYEMKVTGLLATDQNNKYPEISYMLANYAGSININQSINFGIWPYPTLSGSQQLYPASHPTLNQKGKIEIIRMAVDQGGSIVETSEIVWKSHQLTHETGYQTIQGNVSCQSSGICLLYNVKLVPGEIYALVMYSYSFLIKNGATNQYLFGLSVPTVQPVYKHLFFVRSWTLIPPDNFTISFEQSTLILQGKGLLYQNQTRIRSQISSNVTEANFTTKSVNITFQIKNNVLCAILKPPYATVLQQDIHDDQIILRDLNFNGCKSGDIYANIYLWRGIKNEQTGVFSNVFVTNHLNFFMGKFGCHSDCLRCNSTSAYSCLLCADPMKKFLNQGQCRNYGCPSDAPFFDYFKIIYNNTWVQGRQCRERCPEGTFPNYKMKEKYGAVPCQACFPDCQYCNIDSPQQCKRCMPIRFNFKGMCLLSCPDNDLPSYLLSPLNYGYLPAYSNYTCVASKSSLTQSLINVTIVPFGYRHRLPKDQVFYFRAAVSNSMGNITSVLWKQIDPDVDLSGYNGLTSYWARSDVKNKFIFDGLTKMDPVTKYLSTQYAYQKLRMSTFNYFKETDAFRFMVKAENTHSMQQIDVIEVGINDPPKAKDVIITTSEKYHNYTMRTRLNISAIGWYDTVDDTQQELSFKLYIETQSSKRFLVYPSTYQHSIFINLLLPYTSSFYEHGPIDIYLVAQDKYAAQTTRQFQMLVTNAYQAQLRLQVLQELMQICFNESIRDPFYQMMVANTLEVVFESPRMMMMGGSCLSDWHCFEPKGRCVNGRCECMDGGSEETECQMDVDEEWMAKELSKCTLEQVPVYFSNHTNEDDYLNTDLEYLVMLLRGFSKSFVTLAPSLLNQTLTYLNITLNAHLEVVITYQKAFYDDFYETISRLYPYLHTLDGDPLQPHLFDLVRTCERLFTHGLLLKINKQSFNEYTYTTDALTMRLYLIHSQELINNTRNSNSYTLFRLNEIENQLGKEVEIRAPPDFLKDIPQVNEVSDLRVFFAKYSVDPTGTSEDMVIESEIIEFLLMDVNGERIEIEVGDRIVKNGMIEVRIPYQERKRMDQSSMRCMHRDSEGEEFKSESCGIQLYDQNNCLNCSSPGQQGPWKIAVCYCDRLSRNYALIFDQGQLLDSTQSNTSSLIGTNPKLGIYTDFYAMNFWRQSFGFIVIIGAVSVYAFGILMSLVFDVQPQKRLTFKLMRDFRSFDTYLFDQHSEDASQSNNTQYPLLTTNTINNEESSKTFQIPDDTLLTPQMFSHYNRQCMPITALHILEDLYPEQRWIDLTPEELASIKKFEHKDDDSDEEKQKENEKNDEKDEKQNDTAQKQENDKQGQEAGLIEEDNKEEVKKEEVYEGGEEIIEEEKEEDPQSRERRRKEEEDDDGKQPATKSNSGTRQPRGGHQQTTQARKVKDRSKQSKLQTFNLQNQALSQNIQQSALQSQPDQATIQEQNLIQKLLNLGQEDKISQNHISNQQQSLSPEKSNNNNKLFTETKLLDTPKAHKDNISANFKQLTIPEEEKCPNPQNASQFENLDQFDQTAKILTQIKAKTKKFVNPTKKKIFDADPIVQESDLKSEEIEKKSEQITKNEEAKAELDPLELQNLKEERRKKHQQMKEDEVNRLEKQNEPQRFTLINMLKYGNPVSNLICVDSILFPRHARWTLLFINMMLIWFFCAVIYSNTKSPLDVPDFSQNASKLAAQELWISAFAPFGNLLMMYLFAALFRISDQRIKYASDIASIKEMLNELKKEMFLRFFMAYFIAFAMFGAVSYYILQFTSSFGWKISWAWWFSGCGAAIMNFIVYDLLISFVNWLLYRIYNPLGRFLYEIRSVKQAREEA